MGFSGPVGGTRIGAGSDVGSVSLDINLLSLHS